jgi:hypothetical protein
MIDIPSPIFRLCPVLVCKGQLKPHKKGFTCSACGLMTDRQGQVLKNRTEIGPGVPVLQTSANG